MGCISMLVGAGFLAVGLFGAYISSFSARFPIYMALFGAFLIVLPFILDAIGLRIKRQNNGNELSQLNLNHRPSINLGSTFPKQGRPKVFQHTWMRITISIFRAMTTTNELFTLFNRSSGVKVGLLSAKVGELSQEG